MNEMNQVQNEKKVSRAWIALHSKKIERLAIQFGMNAENAASVAEETCRRIYLDLEETFIQNENELLPALYQIAISILLENEEVDLEDSSLLPFEEDYELHQLIIQLKSQIKCPFILSEFHKFNEDEISEILGRSIENINHSIGEAHQLLGKEIGTTVLIKRLDFLWKSYSRIPSILEIEHVFQRKQIKNKKAKSKSLRKGLPFWIAGILVILTLCTVLVVSSEEFQLASTERYIESLPELFEEELSIKLHKLGITNISKEQQNNYMFSYISNARDRFTDFYRIIERAPKNERKLTKTEIQQRYQNVLINLQLPSEMVYSLNNKPLTDDKMKSEEFIRKFYDRYYSICELYSVQLRGYSQYLENEPINNYRIDIYDLLMKQDTFPEEFQSLLEGMLKQNLELISIQEWVDYYPSFKKSEFSKSLRQKLHKDVGGYVTLIEYEPFHLGNDLVYSLKETVNFIQEFENTLNVTDLVTSPYQYVRSIYAELLFEIVIGSDSEKIFDSDGVVKDEVRDAWKTIAAFNGNSSSAFILREIIREMEASDLKSSQKYNNLDVEQFYRAVELAKSGNLSDFFWEVLLNRYDRMVVAFDDSNFHSVVEQLYEMFSQDYELTVLNESLPLEVFGVYNYANQLEDPITMWHLLDHEQNPYSLEEFVKGWEPHVLINEEADQLFAEHHGEMIDGIPLISIGYQTVNTISHFTRMKLDIENSVWLVHDVPISR